MQSDSLLLTISQLAIGLAGFSAVIVTLNPNPIREWDETDRLNLRLLIQISFVTVMFSLLPFLLAISLAPEDVWFYALWAYGSLHLADVSSFLYGLTKETPTIFRVTAYIGLCMALSQVAIALLGNPIIRETAYTVTLVWHLYVTFMAFVLLLYQMRKTD